MKNVSCLFIISLQCFHNVTAVGMCLGVELWARRSKRDPVMLHASGSSPWVDQSETQWRFMLQYHLRNHFLNPTAPACPLPHHQLGVGQSDIMAPRHNTQTHTHTVHTCAHKHQLYGCFDLFVKYLPFTKNPREVYQIQNWSGCHLFSEDQVLLCMTSCNPGPNLSWRPWMLLEAFRRWMWKHREIPLS